MSDSLIQFEVEHSVARIHLNRPDKRNALTQSFLRQLSETVERVRSDDSIRLLCLSARGKVFCAGMDLAEMQQRAEAPNAQQLWLEDSCCYRDLLASLFQLAIPTVAVVQGPALAGGMGLVLACDLVLASEDAFFSLPEPMRGITASMVTPLLIHRVGTGNASYFLLAGKRITARQAQTMGLCHEVVEHHQLQGAVRELEAAILTGAPAALALTKQHLHHCGAATLVEWLDRSIEASATARETDDAREGLAAFLEKRDPRWRETT